MIRSFLVRKGLAESPGLKQLRELAASWVVIGEPRESGRCQTRTEQLFAIIEPILEEAVPAYEREKLETWPADA